MKKTILCSLCQFTGYILVLSSLVVNVQCQRSKGPDITVYSSSNSGDRLTRHSDLKFTGNLKSELPVIIINEDSIFQKIDGFGASFNEAGMICLNSLDPEAKKKFWQALFSPDSGAGFTLMKSPIAACDFASAGPWYSYNDISGDTSMKHFTIERDLGPNGLITFIKNASGYGKFEIQSPMDYAPDWMYYGMKKKPEMNIKPEFYNALANYYLKYLQAYAANGVTINYLVMFNESDCSGGGYSSVTYKEMGEILKSHLISRLQVSGLPAKIMLGEPCSRDEALIKFPVVLDDPEVRNILANLHFMVTTGIIFPVLQTCITSTLIFLCG